MNLNFYPSTKSTIWYKHLFTLFSSFNTRSFVHSIFYNWGDTFPLFLYSVFDSIFRIFGFFLHVLFCQHIIHWKYFLWLIYEFIKAFEIKISIVFRLLFSNNITLCFFFLDNWFILLIRAVIAKSLVLLQPLQYLQEYQLMKQM